MNILSMIKNKLQKNKLEEMSVFFNARSDSYDEKHISMITDGAQSKKIAADYLPDSARNLLDLGVGTGLELAAIFERFPDIEVTGLDIAADMLKKAAEKYPDKHLELLEMSYFDYPFPAEQFDSVISVMTLHHYTHSVKADLYKMIYTTLRNGGVYLECDYMLTGENERKNQREEDKLFAEYDRLKRAQGLDSGEEKYHFDTPCTLQNQIKLLRSAGFAKVEKLWQSGTTVLLRAQK